MHTRKVIYAGAGIGYRTLPSAGGKIRGKPWWQIAAACFCVVSAAISFVPAASALNLGGIGIRPARTSGGNPNWFIYQLGPGASATDAVIVTNETDEEATLLLSAVDWKPTDIGAFGLKGAAEGQTSIGKWVKLSTTTFSLASGTQMLVPFTLTVPMDADVGEHAGGISVQPVSKNYSSQSSGAFITTRVSARIYNTVPGMLIRKLQLLSFLVHDNRETKKYDFTILAKNEGNVTVTPVLKLHIDGWGFVKVPLAGDPELVDFPGLALFGFQKFLPKIIPVDWQLTRGAQVETYVRWRKPYLGRFSAYATLEYDGDKGPEVIKSETFTFTVLPWPETGYVLGVLGFIFLLLVAWFIWRKIHYSGKGWQKYRVKSGDTLTVLSARCQISWKRLAKVNKLKKPFVISTDDTILVPPTAKLTTEHVDSKTVKASAPEKRGRATHQGGRRLTLVVIVVVSAGVLVIAGYLFIRSALKATVPPLPPPPLTTPTSTAATLPSAAAATTTEPIIPPSEISTTTPVVTAPAKDTLAVSILNGSGVAGLAGKMAEIVKGAGYQKVTTGNADAYAYQGVTIRYRNGMKGAAEDLSTLLRDRYQKFVLEEVATSTAGIDVTVILGSGSTP